MLGPRFEQNDRVVGKARAQALEQRNRGDSGFVAGEQAETAAGQRRSLVTCQHDRFDRPRQNGAGEPLVQERLQMRRSARRRAERERHDGRRDAAFAKLPLVHQREHYPHDAEPACGQPARELMHQPADAEPQRFDLVDRTGERERLRSKRGGG